MQNPRATEQELRVVTGYGHFTRRDADGTAPSPHEARHAEPLKAEGHRANGALS